MLDGVIPSSPMSFVHVLSKPVASQELATPLPRRRRRTPGPTTLSCCSSRLAKKAFHLTPALATAQNVLMKKLGLSIEGKLEAVDFERYVCLFNEGLS
jgi:hypothetical protein